MSWLSNTAGSLATHLPSWSLLDPPAHDFQTPVCDGNDDGNDDDNEDDDEDEDEDKDCDDDDKSNKLAKLREGFNNPSHGNFP